jgi:hypothetical protein
MVVTINRLTSHYYYTLIDMDEIDNNLEPVRNPVCCAECGELAEGIEILDELIEYGADWQCQSCRSES